MCTSDNYSEKRKMAKVSLIYMAVSLFCALFGAVYEYFSHEVYSYFMLYAFAIPLSCGAIPFLVMSMRKKGMMSSAARQLYHSGIATFTVGSIVNGALEIYGTTNKLTNVYWYAGTALLAAAFVAQFIAGRRRQL